MLIDDNGLISSTNPVWPYNKIQWPRVELAGRRTTLTTFGSTLIITWLSRRR